MVLSYSAAAKPAEATTSNTSSTPTTSSNAALPSLPTASSSSQHPNIQHLILDAGPLLSLTPLRHLASTFHTTPMVLAELRDPKAREHWDRLGLSGVDVKVEQPGGEAMAKVIAFAKKTGDFAVLSQTDLSVIALTYQYEVLENGAVNIRAEPGQKKLAGSEALPETSEVGLKNKVPQVEAESDGDSSEDQEGQDGEPEEELENSGSVEGVATNDEQETQSNDIGQADSSLESQQTEQDPLSSDDGEGEWITPKNVAKHRSNDLGLLPSGGISAQPPTPLAAACMTGDYAVQNVLLGMGLGLVGEGGKRISKVKSWVLRCHACFKICKDSSKRFCPSCGNPTLLRTTVTTSAKTGQQIVHLKKNFQYHLRGTKYTIPDAKAGRAKGQQKGGTGLILREDQAEWSDAVRAQDRQRQKEERRAAKGALDGWNDPDWIPDILTVGMSGKGRSGGRGMPAVGYGRKNPNQARRKR
ncbi:Nin one binding Zn-ribbon like-domain-containing protein [Naematelia encephala]|uniref:20S-pre-rRNA D-site endonuclease NOB1 n=1 Tax=Naematelia encephala TaxID=71784 RepID=A0A1Y2ALU9_9TREE|nr:Nin one binding Zn-ribbon like-domain-containing protein [Naematelia encephala]